jgi:internalin A
MAKDKAYREAEQKIQQALKSHTTELDLHSMELTELPESIGQLPQLQTLYLSNNKLTILPDSLGQLTQLTELNLSNNQLKALPHSLGQLTQLTELNLSNNQLKALPHSLGQLTQLTELNLSNNQLKALPESLGQLTQLQRLVLMKNKLSTLSGSLGQLLNLQYLDLCDNLLTTLPASFVNLVEMKELELGDAGAGGNPLFEFPDSIRGMDKLKLLRAGKCQLSVLPSWLSQLTELETLFLSANTFTKFPETVCYLKKLRTLYFTKNPITDLPPSLTQLEHLEQLDLSGNPLNPALQSAYDACKRGNYESLFAYLRSLEQNAEPLYEAKLVLVGEGNVGKTTLLKALKGKAGAAPQEHEPTTHGVEIDIHGLRLLHPAKDGVEIQLNAWDFGGQDVYRVTHQFFFSRRSLYLLVWEPRRGVQQCQVEDWLNMIRLRVGNDARVIIVSTNSKTGEHIARIDKPVIKQQYGDMIAGFHEVDSLVPDESTGEMVGIAELKKLIVEEAAKLEQMGMLFNKNWKAAREELIHYPEPRISYSKFSEICIKSHGLSQIDTDTLAHLMHDLGYIVHYSDDEKLHDDVVLKPEWLTKAIGFVLEDRATAENEGILPDKNLYQVWHDHKFKGEPRYNPGLYPFFLRLMEKYDVSYRLPEGDASLVAQHVPQVRPTLPWLPEEEPKENQRRLGMVCVMNETPPGLVPWMIVRTHDYAYPVGKHSLHWQKGMFLRNNHHGEAMLELRGREFHMYAEAIWPEYFMNVLRQRLDKLITDNWPGLQGRYSFTVPCKNNRCEGRFEIAALRDFLNEGDDTIRCQKCRERQNIIELLYGFEDYDVRERLAEIQLTVERGFTDVGAEFEKLRSQIANNFLATMKAIASEAKNGPRLFTLHSRHAGLSPKQLFSRPLEIRLWCEAEGCQHPVYEEGKGVYPINIKHEWVVKAAPYAKFVLGVLKTVAPIAAPSINTIFGAETTKNWKIEDQLDLAKEIIDKLPDEIKIHDHDLSPGQILSKPERSGILALHRFLNESDPTQSNLGLHRVSTYTGDYRWLCKYHYDAWQPNIPDVVQSR